MMTKSDDYVKTFCRIIKAIQNSNDRQEILTLLVESAVEVMQAKACALFLMKSRRDTEGLFYPVAKVGLSDDYVHTGPARGRDIVDDIIMKGGYLAAKDALTDPRLENHEAKRAEGIASLLVVPVIAENDPIGILTLYTAEQREFGDEEIDFLKCLADQGGIAILRSHKAYRNKRYLELLGSVSEHLNSSLDIKIVLHIMTSEITHAFDLLGMTIRLLDDDTGMLKLVASYGLSEKYLNKGEVSSRRLRAVLKKKAEVVEDIDSVDIDYKKERKEEGIVAMLHLPLMVKDEVIGLMGLYSDRSRAITEDDVALMTAIARQCGLAINNASLYLQLKQDKQNLEEEIWGHKAWF